MRIAGLALVMVVLLSFMRQVYAPLAVQIALAFMLLALLSLTRDLRAVIDFFLGLGEKAGVQPGYTVVILRAVGIGYLASFGAQLAKDAKEETVANMVELAGKVGILLLAAPVVAGILDALVGLLP